MSNQRDRMKAEIIEHGRKLRGLFPALADRTPGAGLAEWSSMRKTEPQACDWAARAVHRLEVEARRNAEQWCCGIIEEGTYFDREARTLDRLNKLTGFRAAGVPVFVNSDPRGCALKVAGELDGGATVERFPALEGMTRDWGGDFLLAPTFTGEA